jgi:hypothetical protein
VLRYVWLAAVSRWTAYFDNFVNGSDPFGPISYLAEVLKCRGVQIGFWPQTSTCEGGASFSLFGPEKTDWLNYIRSVSTINDGGRWRWNAKGSIQPFEDTDRYLAKTIQDRLTLDMIDRYC